MSSIAIYHDVYWVFMAMGITAALVLGLTLFSFQTKIDFTGKYKVVRQANNFVKGFKPTHTVAIWTFTFHEKSGCVVDLEGKF